MAGNRFARFTEDAPNRFSRFTSSAPETNGFGAFLSGAADSASFGFGDEAIGLVFGGEARDASRRRQEMNRANHPLAFGGGQIAGAVAGGGGISLGGRAALRLGAPALARAAQGAGVVSRLGAASAAGAAGGAAYEVGQSNGGVADPLSGALWGAGAGALGQGAGEIIGRVGQGIARGASPDVRAASMIGGMQQRYGQTPSALRQALADAPDNAIVGDVIPGGSSLIQGAGARPSAGRDSLRDFYDQRNNDMAQRGADAINRHLLGGSTDDAVTALRRLEDTQRQQAAPLYARVHAGTVNAVPEPLRAFVRFNDRQGAAFSHALNTTRETMRRTLGAEATDEAMQRSPMFWHRLLENVEAEVGASIRGARINPLGAPRGSAVADMTQDARAFNTNVRRLLGPEFRQAQDIYAGAARGQNAIELGYDAVSPTLNSIDLARVQRTLSRMTAGEREHFRLAAANRLRDLIFNADTGSGRVDALRAITRNAGQRRMLEGLFGGERGLANLMREIDGQRELVRNSVESGIGVNSHTADRLLAYQAQAAQTSPTVPSLRDAALRMLTGDAADQYNEAVSNRILSTMAMPARQALSEIDAAGGVERWARRGGLLSRAARESQRGRAMRPQRLGNAAVMGLYAPVGGESLIGYGGY